MAEIVGAYPRTWKLIVENCAPGMYEMSLRNDANQVLLVFTDSSYANCKTAAAAIFGLTWTWDDTHMVTSEVTSLHP